MQNKIRAAVKPLVYVAVGIAAIGGLLFGYDTGVIAAAMLFVKEQFSLSTTLEEIVVSAVLAGAVLGAILGAALQMRHSAHLKSSVAIGRLVIHVASFAIGLGPVRGHYEGITDESK